MNVPKENDVGMSTGDARKLFVAGLPETISEDVLRQLFEATGATVLEVSIPRDRGTGRSRGFGFVTLSTVEDTVLARDVLDGSMQAGKEISVRPFQSAPPRRVEVVAEPPGERTFYIGNLPYGCADSEVVDLLTQVGATAIARLNLPVDAEGRKRGFGFVTMETEQATLDAIAALQGVEMGGRRLVVNVAHPKSDRPQREIRRAPEREHRPREPERAREGWSQPPPPAATPRQTFDERRRSQHKTAAPETEAKAGGAKKRRLERDRGRRQDWRVDYDDDDE